jgi:hypothetical protein
MLAGLVDSHRRPRTDPQGSPAVTAAIGAVVIAWAVGALGVLQLQLALIREDPSAMPGGGLAAVALRSLLWPLILVLAIVALIANGGPR